MYIKSTGKGERVFRDTHRDKIRQKKEKAWCDVHTVRSWKNETGTFLLHCTTLSLVSSFMSSEVCKTTDLLR